MVTIASVQGSRGKNGIDLHVYPSADGVQACFLPGDIHQAQGSRKASLDADEEERFRADGGDRFPDILFGLGTRRVAAIT